MLISEVYQTTWILGIGAIATGFLAFFAMMRLLPFLEKRDNMIQREEVMREAERQRSSIIADAQQQAEETEKLFYEDLDTAITQLHEDLETNEQDLQAQEEYWQQESQRVAKQDTALAERHTALEEMDQRVGVAHAAMVASQRSLTTALAQQSQLDVHKTTTDLAQQVREDRQLECQKVLKSLQEELNSAARKRAQRLLDRVHARYAPSFVWPKAINVVEVADEATLAHINTDSCTLLSELAELSESSVKLLVGNGQEQRATGIVKFAGGFGIYREAARLAFAELIHRPSSEWGRAKGLFLNHKRHLEAEAVELGRKAIEQLELEGIHPEVQKLVGALNWRTSYRQNQWHHTVEVAVFAGIMASELGVDPNLAKRVGLLHDIGKAIDYRIEGSHAVISGDYADRYGESRLVCDTVMSHHADLLVESPLAYILRSADTLSGARPGARVNLEEGYQIRLEAIADVVKSFHGITDWAIMNGGRELHLQVNHNQVAEHAVKDLTQAIARKIEQDVAYPGQIKIMTSRSFECTAVA